MSNSRSGNGMLLAPQSCYLGGNWKMKDLKSRLQVHIDGPHMSMKPVVNTDLASLCYPQSCCFLMYTGNIGVQTLDLNKLNILLECDLN